MLKNLLDPEVQNLTLNSLLLIFLETFFWGWLDDFGVPINIFLAVGTLAMIFDLGNFERDPAPKALLLGSLLAPFWLILRFWIR